MFLMPKPNQILPTALIKASENVGRLIVTDFACSADTCEAQS